MFINFRCIFVMLLLMVLISTSVAAQYYYKDGWNPQQLNKEMAVLKNRKVKEISIKSFDNNGEPSEGFYCEQKLNNSFTMSQTVTRSNVTSQSLLTSYFNAKGLIVKTTDSTETSLNITEYQYDNSDRLSVVKTFAKANDDPNSISEEHNYLYNPAGQLDKMIRRKNNTEVSTVNFKVDENGKVIEEEEVFKTGKGTKYFYYYDNKNNLTDIVHYYARAKRLLPDYMYEYNSAGQINQMITVEEGGGYLIWRYGYNDQGLRESEKCFSKEKKLVGRVEYSYR